MIDICPKCSGKGLRSRTKELDGNEADPDTHPVLAREPVTCERCAGAGRVRLTDDELKAMRAPAP